MAKTVTRIIRFIHDLVRAHLTWLFRVTWERPRSTVALATLLFGLALFSVLTIRFESDIFKLFPARNGALRLFLETLQWTGNAGEAYFLLEGEREKLAPAAEVFAERLKALQVDGRPAFKKVTYRVFDPQEADSFSAFIGYAVTRPHLFLDPTRVEEYLRKLEPASMESSLRRARSELASQLGMGMRGLIAADPLCLREAVLPRLKKGSHSFDLDPESPYFLSRDGRLLIIIAEPALPVQEMAFARKLVAGINKAREGSKVTISCAGAHLSAVIDERVMKRNIIACIISSLAVVLGLFYFTYRRLLPTLLIPFIILYGTVLAMGSAGLFLSSIHIISFAFTALIIGLGTDYSIHIYDRFYSERCAGREAEGALRSAVIDTGQGVFTAAVTTALPFLCLTISEVRALSELGLLVGLGVIFSMYATFLFLPPLLVFSERRFPGRAYRPLPTFGLGAVWRFADRHRRALPLLAFLLTAAAFFASFGVSFEGELKNLQPRHSEAFLTQEKIERHLSLSPKQMIVAVEGKELQELMTRGARIGELAEGYRQRGEISSESWLGSVINDPYAQREIIRLLRQGGAGKGPAESLESALDREGFVPAMFSGVLDGLAAMSRGDVVPVGEAVERLRNSPLRGMADRYLVERDGLFHLLLYLNYQGNEFRQAEFLREMATIDPQARATSVDLVSSQLAGSVKRSFLWGFAIGGILVLILLVVHFESFAGIGSALFPVLAGVAAMLGIMAATGMELNFMNSMVLVTILGMGSDYGLHIHHRLMGPTPDPPAAFTQAGRAVLLSALTTIAGFGSLAFTDYGAMSSIGWATNFGVTATAVFALIFLPAFLGRH
jgi:uncharacterized protein